MIDIVRKSLNECSDPNIAAGSSRFFKEGEAANVYGVKSSDVRRIGKIALKEVKDLSKAEVFNICEQLWKSAYLEEAVIACMLAESLEKQYLPEDFKIFEHWVHNYLTNWADCDTFCNHTVGNFVMMYPQFMSELKKWAKSDRRFVKRAAAVTLIIPARKGLFLQDIFEIANTLLLDADDLVQKGYGWMLKAASESHQKEVFEYVMSKKEVMPRTSLRYAIEKMPADLKSQAMKR